MASFLGIDLLPDRVRGVLIRTQLRRVTIVSYAEVPIVTEVSPAAPAPYGEPAAASVHVGATSPLGSGFGSAPSPFGAPGPYGSGLGGAPSPFGEPGSLGSGLGGAPSPFGGGPFGSSPLGGALGAGASPEATHLGAGGTSGALHEPSRASAPPSPLSTAISELIRRTGAANADVIACLPGEHASLRRIELPKAAEKKIDELLPFEMESLLPFDQADTLLDHQPIDSDPKLLRLLVCAATKSRIRETLDLLAGAGADPTELVPGAVPLGALALAVPALAGEGPHVVVSLRPGSTDICVVRKGHTELARTLSSGAASLAMQPGAGPAVEAGEHFVRELKQTLLSWRMQGGAEPEAIFLAGDAPAGSGISEWLSTALGRTVLPLALPDPQPGGGAPDASVRHGFATALGLALHATVRARHIDLRKGDLEKKRSTTFLRELAPILGVAAMAVASAFVFSLWARWSVLSARREMLEDELARVTETRLGEETRSASRARRLLETGRAGDDPMPPATAYDILVAISNAVPDGIAHDLSRLSIDLGDARSGGRLEIQGTVATIEERDRIAEALGAVECLHALELGPMTNTSDGRRNYRLEADILCASPDDEAEDEEDDDAADAAGEGEG